MKRFRTIRFIKREEPVDGREPTILDHGGPVTTELVREIEARKRRLRLSDSQPAGL
ncbi:MAG: hypothetical protein AAFP91_12770 [Pseudomonadota bacterium]